MNNRSEVIGDLGELAASRGYSKYYGPITPKEVKVYAPRLPGVDILWLKGGNVVPPLQFEEFKAPGYGERRMWVVTPAAEAVPPASPRAPTSPGQRSPPSAAAATAKAAVAAVTYLSPRSPPPVPKLEVKAVQAGDFASMLRDLEEYITKYGASLWNAMLSSANVEELVSRGKWKDFSDHLREAIRAAPDNDSYALVVRAMIPLIIGNFVVEPETLEEVAITETIDLLLRYLARYARISFIRSLEAVLTKIRRDSESDVKYWENFRDRILWVSLREGGTTIRYLLVLIQRYLKYHIDNAIEILRAELEQRI